MPALRLIVLLLGCAPGAQQPATGTRLVYDLPAYDVGRLIDARPGTSVDALMTDVRSRLQAQLGTNAVVTSLGGTQFAVDFGGGDVAALRQRIENKALEIRVVATADFAQDGIKFDLPQEKARLAAWLRNGGSALVRADPRAIERFNTDADHGPLAFEHLRWVPHLVTTQRRKPKRWEPPLAFATTGGEGVPALADSTIAAFDEAAEWNDGIVPDELRKASHPALLEFVAINCKEVAFGGVDVDQDAICITDGPDGKPAIYYRIRADRADAFASWAQKYASRHAVLVVNGIAVSAPTVASRTPGVGQLTGLPSDEVTQDLAHRLHAGDLPIAPVLLRASPLPRPK